VGKVAFACQQGQLVERGSLRVAEGSSRPEELGALSSSRPEPAEVTQGLPTAVFELAGVRSRPWLRSIVTFAVVVVVVALLFRKLQLRTATELLKHASLPLLALSAGALCVFQLLRAARWTIILTGKVNFLALLMYSSVGTLVSLVTAAQAGELVKPALVRARHGVPYFVTAASVAVERLLDVASLVLMGLFAIIALPAGALGPAWIGTALKAGGLLCALGFLALVLGSRWAGGLLVVVSRVLSLFHLPDRFTDRVARIVMVFLDGAREALSPTRLPWAMVCSVVLWTVNAASVAIVFRAVNRPIASAAVVLLGFAVLSFGAVMPLTPGCVGQYEGLWLVVFAALRVGPQSAVLAAGLLSHGLIILTIALFGLPSLAFLRLYDSSARSRQDAQMFKRS
jgi:uncharacterized protein (TIRG00374 family)